MQLLQILHCKPPDFLNQLQSFPLKLVPGCGPTGLELGEDCVTNKTPLFPASV